MKVRIRINIYNFNHLNPIDTKGQKLLTMDSFDHIIRCAGESYFVTLNLKQNLGQLKFSVQIKLYSSSDEGVESYTYEERKPKNPGEEWVEYTDALGRCGHFTNAFLDIFL